MTDHAEGDPGADPQDAKLIDRLKRLGMRREAEGIYTDQNIAVQAAARLEELLAGGGTALAALKAELDEARGDEETESDHWHRLAVDDPGKNPPRLWRDIAREAEVRAAAAEAALSAEQQANAVLRQDAERWNALLRCARIRMQGSAGFDPLTGERREYDSGAGGFRPGTDGWVHFGAEFWSVYPGYEDEDKKGRWGSVALTALADDVLLKESQGKDDSAPTS